jgi:hypothetical protein
MKWAVNGIGMGMGRNGRRGGGRGRRGNGIKVGCNRMERMDRERGTTLCPLKRKRRKQRKSQ